MQDKNKDNREQAEAKFKEVSEAFEVRQNSLAEPFFCFCHQQHVSSLPWANVVCAQVLSDPQKKRIYDAYGEDGLKGGGPSDSGSHSGFSSFRPRDAEDIFAEVCHPINSSQAGLWA